MQTDSHEPLENSVAMGRKLSIFSLEERIRSACLAYLKASVAGENVQFWDDANRQASDLKRYLEANKIDLRTLRSVIG